MLAELSTALPEAKYLKDYRSPEFTIFEVNLDFKLHAKQTIVTSTSQFERLYGETKTLRLDGSDMELLSVKLNGQVVEFVQDLLGLTIEVGDLQKFEIEIQTQLNPAKNTSFQGLYQSGESLCTQCEAESFRKITYFLDRPDVLARYCVKITADQAKYPYLLSNGNLVEQGNLGNGEHYVVWQDPFPKPSYLFALVAGKFDVLEDKFTTRSGREVKLQLFVDEGNLNRADFAMASLKKAMLWDEQRFNLEYDLDIYMIVAVNFFNMGAMENKGLNIFNSKYVLANSQTATDDDYFGVESVIGHEYFHNWTGNRVTCRDWFQLSLKEGLTVFRDQEFSSDTGLASINRIQNVKVLRTHQFAEDASPMAHPIRPEKVIEMNNFYTMTVYEKGAEVIRMLHTLLGEEKFQQGMQKYIQTNDGKAVTCDDFVQAMQSATKLDLTLFKRWYSQSGTPILKVQDEYLPEQKIYRLTFHQHTPPTFDQAHKQALMIPVKFSLYTSAGKKIPLAENMLILEQECQTFEFNNIDKKPIPALLEDFSAPVKLDYAYILQDLVTLMQCAENDFVRWDSLQIAWQMVLQTNLATQTQNQNLPVEFVSGLGKFFSNSQGKEAITALMLTVPNAVELMESLEQANPETVQDFYVFANRHLAQSLQFQLEQTYASLKQPSYVFTQEAVAKRALCNQCLYLLAWTQSDKANNLVWEHYFTADNMTDKLSALKSATQANLACAEELLADFEQTWKHDGLVMDKWFALQAQRTDTKALERIQNLIHHSSFSLSNPNRTRSLLGSFAMYNLAKFHNADGSGYAFLTDMLIKLNHSNPQVASRLLDPLMRFEKLDPHRQALIKTQLHRLKATNNLSKDLFEKISKVLGEA